MACPVLDIDDLCIASSCAIADSEHRAAGITLKLNAGEIALVVGMEKAGKSRLLRSVCGLAPSRGLVKICGIDGEADKARDLFGYVPARNGLYKELTCLQYLSTFAEIYNVERHYRPYIIREALELMRLQGLENTVIASIADEFKLRCLSIARALVHDPRLLIIDDVFNGISGASQHTFADILNDIRSRGKALLLAGKQLGGLENVADQVCYLQNGEPYLQGWVSDMGRELAKHHLFQLQILNSGAHQAKNKMMSLTEHDEFIEIAYVNNEHTLVRFVFRGEPEEFQAWVHFLTLKGLNVVSCWEDSAFFAHTV